MRADGISTGALFGLIAVAHVWRMIGEPHLASHAWYMNGMSPDCRPHGVTPGRVARRA